tara:strand:- start:290 stop:940 length:651 start_codon:yes stop_codon:yes gene_type:complete
MDEVTTSTNKSKKDETIVEELFQENKQNPEKIDVSIFDETLKEIDQILNSLKQKSEVDKDQIEILDALPEIKTAISKINIARNELTKEENNLIKDSNLLKRIEVLEKKFTYINEVTSLSQDLKNESIIETQEHKIDQNLLSIEELNFFKENAEKKIKNSFGFYSYLILITVIFLAIYGALTFSKDLIILKYPVTELYINYLYEITEIIKITILSFF